MRSESTKPRTPLALAALKTRARDMRSAAEAAGRDMTHSAALEALAHDLGIRDWNTLSAMAMTDAGHQMHPGDRVAGWYLGHAFEGDVLRAEPRSAEGWQRLTVRFDEPVDVVESESFSALRRQVSAVIDSHGETAEKISDGTPHMRVYRPIAGPIPQDRRASG